MYKRVLLKLSGESLGKEKEGLDFALVLEVCNYVKFLIEKGYEIVIVVGGGNYWRGRDNLEIEKVTSDTIGMLGTIINALALKDGFRQVGIKAIVSTPFNFNELLPQYKSQELVSALDLKNVVIFGGGIGKSGYSTDSAASHEAVVTKCDLIVKLTNVDGVYDRDPSVDKDAQKYDQISFKEVLDKGLKIMDLSAIKECMENNISIAVINFKDKDNLLRILNQEKVGTLISNEKSN